jgi:hypothetical protein
MTLFRAWRQSLRWPGTALPIVVTIALASAGKNSSAFEGERFDSGEVKDVWQTVRTGVHGGGSGTGYGDRHGGARAGARVRPTGKLKVTVEYKGQLGTVDKNRKIWIWLFDTPHITTDSTPLATGWLTENNSSYSFTSLPKTVYIAAGFDARGGYDGTMSAAVSGTPVTIHGSPTGDGQATAVATGGDRAAVTVTFDDTMRIP